MLEPVKNAYLSLCYHYVRSKAANALFPTLLGNTEEDFRIQIESFQKHFDYTYLDEVRDFHNNKIDFEGKLKLLITFDDGLTDHYLAAKILQEYRVKAVFFVPTCIFVDKLPANPTIIHYALEKYRVDGFLDAYRKALNTLGMPLNKFDIQYTKGKDDPWAVIREIKVQFKYKFGGKEGRDILIHIYENTLLKDYPNIMDIMHCSVGELQEMIDMGHSLGVHTHNHISVSASDLTKEEFFDEIIKPQQYFKEYFGIDAYSLSYPYGKKDDCYDSDTLNGKTAKFDIAVTVEEKMNFRNTNPFEIGRYQPMSFDTADSILDKLEEIKSKSLNHENSSINK